jgi:enoyl-CoA hydratase
MNYETIEFEQKNSIGIIFLNRSERLNALNGQLFKDLESIFCQMADDKSIKVLIISGKGKCFCAGADIQEVVNIDRPFEAHFFLRKAQTIFSLIEHFPKPVIAAINGFAVGGGFELALACDLRVASREAYMGLPEIKIGALPGGGGTQRLPRLIGVARAKEMIFTGETIPADEALKMGLINRMTDAENLIGTAIQLANKIKDKPIHALKMAKLAINRGMNMDLDSALELEAQCVAMLFSTEDRKEGMKAFLEKRLPRFSGE